MTLEELKAEAKAKGYKLIKDEPYIRQSTCICGAKNTSMWWKGNDVCKLKCRKCGFASESWVKTQKEAKIAWNKAVEEAKANET